MIETAALPATLRAFIALKLDRTVEAEISALIDRLRSPNDGIRWVRPSNFHLTLFFLGPAMARERIGPVAEALGTVAATSAPFDLEARGMGVLPDAARPRVIWIGLHSPELIELAECVAEAVERCSFRRERRGYLPHLTIGRVRSPKSWRAMRLKFEQAADRNFGISRIGRIILYRSELGSESARYHEIAAFPLGATGVPRGHM